jgi:hypothetical protein
VHGTSTVRCCCCSSAYIPICLAHLGLGEWAAFVGGRCGCRRHAIVVFDVTIHATAIRDVSIVRDMPTDVVMGIFCKEGFDFGKGGSYAPVADGSVRAITTAMAYEVRFELSIEAVSRTVSSAPAAAAYKDEDEESDGGNAA